MLLSFAVVFGMRYDVGEDHLGYLDGYINPFLHKEYEPLFALIRDTLVMQVYIQSFFLRFVLSFKCFVFSIL